MGTDTKNPANAIPVWIAPSLIQTTLTHLTSSGSTLIATGPGYMTELSINTTGNGSLTVRDGTDATGTVMGVFDLSKQGPSVGISSPWPYKNGLWVNMGGSADVTIISHG